MRNPDAMILDGSMRQSLAVTRSLGRRGLRLVTAESSDLVPPLRLAPTFWSKWSAVTEYLPSYHEDADSYAGAILDLALAYQVPTVIPSTDGSVAALRPWRSRFEIAGVTLPLAAETALTVANDKQQTLALAAELGIGGPRSVSPDCAGDMRSALAEVGLPAVVKPARSWVDRGATSKRVVSAVVTSRAEALAAVDYLHGIGIPAVVQQWVGGRREAVNLFYQNGAVRAAIAQVAHRTTPVLGGVSVIRETIAMPDDIWKAAVRFLEALDLEGYSEIEFRRDAEGRPLVMEINARLTAGVELGSQAGVDFPWMVSRWAGGEDIPGQLGYRTGVRMRFLGGDLEWLWENLKRQESPDSVPRLRATMAFVREFLRRQGYDYVNRNDMRPALVAALRDVTDARRRARAKSTRKRLDSATTERSRTERFSGCAGIRGSVRGSILQGQDSGRESGGRTIVEA